VPFLETWVTEDTAGCFAYNLGLKVIWLNLDSWV
jgi:hypothetical protein